MIIQFFFSSILRVHSSRYHLLPSFQTIHIFFFLIIEPVKNFNERNLSSVIYSLNERLVSHNHIGQ